jgi:biotin-(acetyl-CoA carboxylase) ligase
LKSGNPDALDKLDHDYEKSLLGSGVSQGFFAGKNQFDGTIRGVDELGRLKVELENKKIQLFNHKEIEQNIPTTTTL